MEEQTIIIMDAETLGARITQLENRIGNKLTNMAQEIVILRAEVKALKDEIQHGN